MIEYINVNDFEFILGLDGFYRKNMKKYETNKILPLLYSIIIELNIELKKYEIEGYYYETKELKDYFTIVKNFKDIKVENIQKFKKYEGYNKLIELFCSGLFGDYDFNESIIPSIKDTLNISLRDIEKNQYNQENILNYAFELIKNKCYYCRIGNFNKRSCSCNSIV